MGGIKLSFWDKAKYIMLRLSFNSLNVDNWSTERIPAIHVSGHDMATEAGVDRPQKANMCMSTTPIVLSQDELGLHIWYNGQPMLEAWGHWTPPVLVSLLHRDSIRLFGSNKAPFGY